MQIRKLYPFFIIFSITLVFVIHGAAQNTADDAPATDYFEQVTLFSGGRITRFTQMPIRVHISPTLKALPYLNEIRYAMNTWESATDGKIRFQETETPEQADIRVTSTYTGNLSFLDTRLGTANLTRLEQGTYTVSSTKPQAQRRDTDQSSNTVGGGSPAPSIDFTVEVILVLESDGTTGELSQQKMRTVCLHEFGHAIGLWGHSPNTDDVCHAMATAQHPTPRDINTLLKIYNTPLHTSQHDIAIDLLKKEIQRNPRLARPHYLLGAVYFDKGDTALAIPNFQNCLGVDPNYEPAWTKLIQAYQKTGQSSQAARLVEQRVKSQQGHRSLRDSAESYNRLGTLHYQQGDTDKAIQAFESALKRSPHHKTAKQNLNQLYRQKAFNALKRRAFDEATAYFEKAIRLDPMNATTYRVMGDGYALASEFAQAITHYQKALELTPDDAEAQKNLVISWTNHGVTLRNKGEWDAAIRAYRNALVLQPTYQLAKTNLIDALSQKADTQRQSGRSDEAIATYLELQKLQPDDPTIESLLGELYLKIRDYPAAISAFHKVYTAQSTKQTTNEQARRNLSAAYQQYAQTLRNQRDYTASATQLQKAVDLFPKDINLRLSLSQAYQHLGKYEQAQSELEQILAQDPDNKNAKTELVNIQIRRGNALMNRQRYAEAAAVFESIPASEKTLDMHNTIGYLYLMQGEHFKALATFETVLTRQPKNAVAYQNLLSLESQLDVALSKARETTTPVPGTGETASVPDTVPDTADPIAEKLSRVQCVLARCLINRKQSKEAMEKYRQALDAKPYTPELRTVLIDTGKQLANRFQKQNDTERYDTITRWVKEHTDESL
ncbi:tetratricopeptide repeat protein [Candidatus Poribacteria bacterium]|nr:tetratricopeptide repeat protein [Candidatus Poribacteria bacterium]MYH81834.1 tetratricopeptide repeat protein [Candidatus Poribacteria bacterium]MYK93356.1 tetratricopeptide repeat protein [Candidatus Poribacteria bacterium]